MRKIIFVILVLTLISASLPALAQIKRVSEQTTDKHAKDVNRAIEHSTISVQRLREIMGSGRTRLPKFVLSSAETFAIISSKTKSDEEEKDCDAIGLVCARDARTRKWGAPLFLSLKGGKIQGQFETDSIVSRFNEHECDLVLVGMNKRSLAFFLNNEFSLGDDVLVLPGTFAELGEPGAEIPALSSGMFGYFHRHGVIIGMSAFDSQIKQNKDLNDAIYEERKLDNFPEINKFIPPDVLALTNLLNQVAVAPERQ
jgi:lipid-binding SYLF domain-containing protein